MIKKIIRKGLQQIRISLGIIELKTNIQTIKEIQAENYRITQLQNNPRYRTKKRLNQFEYKLFSQFGEDGIIEEIFQRIGTKNKFFVEIGSGDGIENNTTNLLTNGWQGIWIEADPSLCESAQDYFSEFIKVKRLKVIQLFITTKNASKTLLANNVPKELDLLSTDIDGNDYWILESLSGLNPRVISIEFNSSLGKSAQWIMKYAPNHSYDNSTYHGASLKSLELLGRKLGYCLVGCSMAGVNAFFVRKDLVKDKFLKPYTSENHYESPKYFLYSRPGHPKSGKLFKDYILDKNPHNPTGIRKTL
jgi:hypothetical protein